MSATFPPRRRRFPISLVMIVRDEEATLGRCLASAQGLVEEIVVVDTGSTDSTVQIAQEYGATVHHLTWTDDFAAARNHALAHATHPWRLVLDADEWILDRAAAQELLDQVGQSTPDFLGIVDMLQTREDGTLDTGVLPIELGRLLPRHVTYRGRVHEQPTPEIEAKRLHLLLGHDGYTAAAKERKAGRNTALLIAAIEAEPGNAYLWYQLGSEYSTRGQYAEALGYLVQAYNLTHPAAPGVPAPEPRPWWHRLTLRLILALTAAGRHEDAVGVADMEAAAWADSADFHYVQGRAQRALAVSLDEDQASRAEQLVVSSMDRWIRAVELGDRREYAGVLAQRATVLAARLVAEDYETLGRAEDAARYRAIA